jgi:hypothetical protein
VIAADWLAALRAYLVATTTLHFLWETAQLPLYEIGWTGTMAEKAFAVVHCTMGDVLIALASLAGVLVIAGDRAWPGRGFVRIAVLALVIGLAYMVFSEYRNVEVLQSWTYSALMPRVPPLGTGLSPILQWMVVPTAAFAWARHRSTPPVRKTRMIQDRAGSATNRSRHPALQKK